MLRPRDGNEITGGRKLKMGRRKDTTITALKKKLWKIFSIYIRMRDCIRTTGTTTHGLCCTCGRDYPIGKLQAGHFIPGREDCILFDPACVHAQCYRCNVQRSGEWVKYFRFMETRYSREFIFKLMAKSEIKCKITTEWIERTTEYYLKRINEMETVNV